MHLDNKISSEDTRPEFSVPDGMTAKQLPAVKARSPLCDALRSISRNSEGQNNLNSQDMVGANPDDGLFHRITVLGAQLATVEAKVVRLHEEKEALQKQHEDNLQAENTKKADALRKQTEVHRAQLASWKHKYSLNTDEAKRNDGERFQRSEVAQLSEQMLLLGEYQTAAPSLRHEHQEQIRDLESNPDHQKVADRERISSLMAQKEQAQQSTAERHAEDIDALIAEHHDEVNKLQRKHSDAKRSIEKSAEELERYQQQCRSLAFAEEVEALMLEAGSSRQASQPTQGDVLPRPFSYWDHSPAHHEHPEAECEWCESGVFPWEYWV